MNSCTLVEENLGLVHMCAVRFRERGIEYEELYSAGCLGLVKASKRFDASLGFAFSTYAVPVILGEIRQCFRTNGEVSVSRGMREKARECSKTLEKLESEKGRKIGVCELADAMNMSVAETAQLMNVAAPTISIDENDEMGMNLPDKSFENESVDRLTVNDLLLALDERDRRLIILRYFEEKTQNQVADELKMTQVQVSRREKALLTLLRNKFENVSVIW